MSQGTLVGLERVVPTLEGGREGLARPILPPKVTVARL